MKRVVFALIASTLTAATLFAAMPVLDQSAPVDPSVALTWVVGGADHQIVAQTLTVGIGGKLVEARIPIGNCVSGTLIVEIRDVDPSTGEPGSTVLVSRRYRADDFPEVVTASFEPLRLGGRVGVAAGDRVSIVVSNPTGSCGIAQGPGGNPYAGGSGYSQDDLSPGVWVPLNTGIGGSDDMPFQTWVRVTGGP